MMLITASHLVTPLTTPNDIRVYHIGNPLGTVIGPIEHDSKFRIRVPTGNPADAASLGLSNADDLNILVNKIKHNGEILTVTSFGGANDLTNTPIHIAGVRNQGSGGIQYKNVTLEVQNEPENALLINQISGSYKAESGDSGAPIFVKDGTKATMLGIHVASGCTITPNGQAPIDLRYNLDGVRVCDSDDGGVFHFFTPWENIVTSLELRQ